jgi:DNA-binding NarL/FixJ family response regulator
VLKQLALGKSNKEIAADLVIAEKTVRTHVSSILAKLGVSSRTQAVLHAVRSGLVSLDSAG